MKSPAILELSVDELSACLARVQGCVEPADFEVLQALVRAYQVVLQALSAARVSVARLKRLFFGPKSEKSKDVLQKDSGQDPANKEDKGAPGEGGNGRKAKPKGHGRNGVDDYAGAIRIPVPHPNFYKGCPCPNESCTGKLYLLKDPGKILRVVGQAPLMAKVWEPERWRCHFCEEIFSAELPPEARGPKYDATAVATIALLHFGQGMAFNRLAVHQKEQGIPVPAPDQSELLKKAARELRPVFNELKCCGAQGEILHNDDTGNRILALYKKTEQQQQTAPIASAQGKEGRTGTFTTGIVAVSGSHTIALYFTGRQHAGENLGDLLQQRDPSLGPPIHMSDGLDHNEPPGVQTKQAKCLVHGRRQFVDIQASFPAQTERVIAVLREVYRVDALAKERNLTPRERLFLHQEKSAPVMDKLHRWLMDQLLGDSVEPNSGLGKAIQYVLKRWKPLTLFLREPGAPLDNNINERMLKAAIRHRRNSLFFKTENGASVGDLFMSLIETCRRNGVEAFDYLTTLLRNAPCLAQNPAAWLPWAYRTTLASQAQAEIPVLSGRYPDAAIPPGRMPRPSARPDARHCDCLPAPSP